jgi:hypothetical protein
MAHSSTLHTAAQKLMNKLLEYGTQQHPAHSSTKTEEQIA